MFCAAKSFSFVQFHPNSSVRCGVKIQNRTGMLLSGYGKTRETE